MVLLVYLILAPVPLEFVYKSCGRENMFWTLHHFSFYNFDFVIMFLFSTAQNIHRQTHASTLIFKKQDFT